MQTDTFTKKIDGKTTGLYRLANKNGVFATFTNYGARWVQMVIPDKSGNLIDVVSGFDSINGYLQATETYYGAI
ncbi:MAG: galactose-1-epimerase, partial [Ferruginibacter sp.]